MIAVASAAVAVSAMPTKAELQKAQELVSDVTAADVKALKAKTKTPAEVAAKHMELAGQAGNEAEKYLLLQGAFKLYAKAGDYEGAANALGTMNREIADMPPEVIVEIYNRAISSSMKQKAPKLHAIKEAARRQVFYRKQLAKAEAAVKANPKDAAAQKKLGECHAELGDWPKALDAFALAGGALAKTAAAEKNGTAAPQVSGDFWWDYESGDEMSTYKLHAAELYRTALADDSFKGLARTRTEQRVKEAEDVAQIVGSSLEAKSTAGAKSDLPTVAGGEIFRIVLDAQKNVSIDFVACPPGIFEDGRHPSGNHKKHVIELTYPFLIMPGRLTYAVVTALDRKSGRECRQRQPEKWSRYITDDTPVIDLYRREFEQCLSKLEALAAKDRNFRKFRDYEFRLATLAEHYYACWAGDTAANMGRFSDGDREKSWLSLGCPKGRSVYDYPPLPESYVLKTRGKNAWGLYDMMDGMEPLADRIPAPLGKDGKLAYMLLSATNDVCCYADEEINPLRWYTGKDACGVSGCQWIACGGLGAKNGRMRLVYGPKLSALNVYPRTANDGPVKRIGEEQSTAKKTVADAKNANDSYPREDFGGVLLSSKYEIVESTGRLRHVNYQDGLFNCQKPSKGDKDFAFEISAKEKEVGFTLKLSEPVTLAGLLVVNRLGCCQERQVPLCVWASEDRVKWERVFIDESIRAEYRIDLSNKNITCKYLRFGRQPGVNNEPFHLARTLVYAKKAGAGIGQPGNSSHVSVKAPTPENVANRTFDLGCERKLEMIACPAGMFTMGEKTVKGDCNEVHKHQVKITRPFWLGKVAVTRSQWTMIMYGAVIGEKENCQYDFAAVNSHRGRKRQFMEKLNKMFAAELPKGYVFRLPTEAELAYAMTSGGRDKVTESSIGTLGPSVSDKGNIIRELHEKGAKLEKASVDRATKVGTSKPNSWGFYDVINNGYPEVLDMVAPNSRMRKMKRDDKGNYLNVSYEDFETDPLCWDEGEKDAAPLHCDQAKFWVRCTLGDYGWNETFRVCLGPDLIAEKKAKK